MKIYTNRTPCYAADLKDKVWIAKLQKLTLIIGGKSIQEGVEGHLEALSNSYLTKMHPVAGLPPPPLSLAELRSSETFAISFWLFLKQPFLSWLLLQWFQAKEKWQELEVIHGRQRMGPPRAKAHVNRKDHLLLAQGIHGDRIPSGSEGAVGKHATTCMRRAWDVPPACFTHMRTHTHRQNVILLWDIWVETGTEK